MIVERLRRLQEAFVEIGIARSVLALPAPKTLLLEDKSSTDGGKTTAFASLVTEKEIVDVARDLFASGFYNNAVAEAYKAVDNYVRDRTSSSDSGFSMMDRTFSSKKTGPCVVRTGDYFRAKPARRVSSAVLRSYVGDTKSHHT